MDSQTRASTTRDTMIESLQLEVSRLTAAREDFRHQITGLEEEVAIWKRAAREDKINLEARIEEVEEQKAAAEEKMIKKEEIFQEKLGKLKARKKGEKFRNVEERVSSLESALAEAEEEKGNSQTTFISIITLLLLFIIRLPAAQTGGVGGYRG